MAFLSFSLGPSRSPHFHILVLAAGGDAVSIQGPVNAVDLVRVAGQLDLHLLRLHVPHLYRAVLAGACQEPVIRGPADLVHRPNVATQVGDKLARLSVPQLN